jgi:hypothetical protein
MPGKKKLSVAITAMSIATLGGGIAAAGAQAQSETLTGTATTTGGATPYALCLGNKPASATANFNASGSSSGFYSGTFTETNARATLSRTASSMQLKLSIPFTITSGTTTITGTITNPSPYGGGAFLCFGGSFYIGGVAVNTNTAAWAATIQPSGQKISGTAQVNGGFWFRGLHRQTTVTETLIGFPSP